MPTYEFRCPQGHDFEKLYRTIGGAESQAACPACGALAGRIMSAAGFAFKGSGFYLTDYGKDAHRTKGAIEPKASNAGEGGSSASGESSSSGAEPKSESKSADSKPAESKSAESKGPVSKGAESKPTAPAPKPSASE
jgi:putative FmdB family regulatory protein